MFTTLLFKNFPGLVKTTVRTFLITAIMGLASISFCVSGADAISELVLPELQWGTKPEAIKAKARGELYIEQDDHLWYTSYDVYEGCIVDTQYWFDENNEFDGFVWSMRPQIETGVDLGQMLTEYNELKDALLARYGQPGCGNQKVVKKGKEEDTTYPDQPPAPAAKDLEAGIGYFFESRWCTDELSIYLYVSVSEEGKASINASFHK